MLVQALLGEFLDSQAAWRAFKAEEYPADDRNLRSSEALRDLAAYVRELPDSDSTIRRMARAMRGPPSDPFPVGEHASSFAARIGFGYLPVSASAELERFAECIERDTRELERDLERDLLSEKVQEQRIRRAAGRRDLILRKSRRRDPRASDFGIYWLIDASTNTLVYGGDLEGLEYYLDRVTRSLPG